jgi:hypothetical protein
MRVARITMAVSQECELRAQAFRSTGTGEPVGWLEIGDVEVGIHGSPAELRRLSRAVLQAAEHAEELGRCDTVRLEAA